jgi:hypothetical protein
MWAATIEDLEIHHYIPKNPKNGMLIPPPIFRGKVVITKGDTDSD